MVRGGFPYLGSEADDHHRNPNIIWWATKLSSPITSCTANRTPLRLPPSPLSQGLTLASPAIFTETLLLKSCSLIERGELFHQASRRHTEDDLCTVLSKPMTPHGLQDSHCMGKKKVNA